MGVMTDAVGYDCSNCHPGAGTDTQDWVTDRSPKKVMARKMVDMVAAINKTFFNGTQQVTCWTCHHGLDLPTTSIALDKLYGEPLDEKRDIVLPQDGEPAASKIFDDYIQAIGGAQKVNAMKSYVATGTSVGYGGVGGTAAFEVDAEVPSSRGMWIHFPEHPDRGVSAWTYNGKTGWISQPRAYIPIYELTGNDLIGAKLDGVIEMPSELPKAFNTWRVGPRTRSTAKTFTCYRARARAAACSARCTSIRNPTSWCGSCGARLHRWDASPFSRTSTTIRKRTASSSRSTTRSYGSTDVSRRISIT